jgi:hypothetical protein
MLPAELTQLARLYRAANFYAAAPWRDLFDIDKAALLRAVRPYSRLGWRALSALYDGAATLEREHIAGDVLASGNSVAASSALIAGVVESNPARQVWVFDADSSEPAETLFRRLYLNPLRKQFRHGAPLQKDHIPGLALLYLERSRTPLEALYGQVAAGGFIFLAGWDRPSIDASLAACGAKHGVRKADANLVFFRKS